MRPFLSIKWRLTAGYLLVVLTIIALLGFYLENHTEKQYIKRLQRNLTTEAYAVGTAITLSDGSIDNLVKQLSKDLGCRITVIEPSGLVAADSSENPKEMESHSKRPEIIGALDTGQGFTIRHSDTLDMDMMYVSVLIKDNDRSLVVRIAEPLSEVDAAKSAIRTTFGIAALAALLLAAAVGLKLASGVVSPVVSLTTTARRIARGDFGLNVGVPSGAKDEVTELGLTLNSLGAELRRAVRQLREDKRKMETVFEKTDDGLIILDNEGRIETINPAAAKMLAVDAASAVGRTIIEATLNHEFAELIGRVLRTQSPATLEIAFPSPSEKTIHVYVTSLGQPEELDGAVVVMHDVTAARRVDDMRRDFVANVSHELRTPLASIRAMAETIMLRGKSNPEAAEQFAQSIVSEIDRLVRLSDDLLEIAKTEVQQRPIHKEEVRIAEVAADATAKIQPVADQKSVSLVLDIDPELVIQADKDAIWQILVNLIDNAVNYTSGGGEVKVSTVVQDGFISVSVADTGIGIPAADIPRIFERFYRVDKARSRASGGTGLGLSIVKHLVEAHGGKISVVSEVNNGSTFTFTIPRS
ncbi:MAG TPA: ATP-binding protein [Armatimonadota bacterium]|nr:ATP-binding protein [Armatimonadota bacterium]